MTTVLEILENLGLDDDAIKEVQENLEKFDDLAECLESCEELTKKQVKILNEQLKLVFQKLKQGIDEDTGGLIDEAEGNDEVDATELDLKVIPLIVIQHEMQETIMVEKYVLSVPGVEYLCNLLPESERGDIDIMYTTTSGAPAINFKALDKMTIECVGVFGPLKAVFKNLQKHFPKSNLIEHEKVLEQKESGLFMLDIKNKKRKFLIFISKNDSDFSLVKKDSRAVHFLRYMSQLANNVIMCLDENYLDRLGKEEKSEGLRKNRKAVYKIENQELQPESFSLKELGMLSGELISTFTHFFSSGNGFMAAKFENKPEYRTKTSTKTRLDLNAIKSKMNSMPIENVENVDTEFKKEYLKTFAEDAYKVIEAEEESKAQMFEDKIFTNIKRYIACVIVESLGCEFELGLSSAVALKFLAKEKTDAKVSTINRNQKLMSDGDLARIKNNLKNSTDENKNAIKKYLLWNVLVNKNLLSSSEHRSYDEYNWEDVKKLRETSLKRFFHWQSANIEKELEKAEKELDYSKNSKFFSKNVNAFINFLVEVSETQQPNFLDLCHKLEEEVKQKKPGAATE